MAAAAVAVVESDLVVLFEVLELVVVVEVKHVVGAAVDVASLAEPCDGTEVLGEKTSLE